MSMIAKVVNFFHKKNYIFVNECIKTNSCLDYKNTYQLKIKRKKL